MRGFEATPCLLCQSSGPHAVLGRDCNSDGSFTLLYCDGCQSVFQPEPVMADPGLTWVHDARIRCRLELYWDVAGPAAILAMLSRKAGSRFLHVGCGFGFVVDMASELMAWTANGLDPSEEAEVGQTLFGAVIQRAWVDEDEIPDGPFDVVLVSDALRHCDTPAALMRTIRSRLAPGGTVLVETASASALPMPLTGERCAGLMPTGSRSILPSAQGLQALLQASGFDDAACAEVGPTARAWSGPLLQAVGTGEVADLVERYLCSLRSRMRPASPVWNAAMAGLFHLQVDRFAFLAAQELLADMGAAWEEPYGIDPARPWLVPTMVIGHEPPDAVGYPLVLALVLADQARNVRRMPGCDPLQALAFDRKAYSVGVHTARYLELLGQPSAMINAVARDSRAKLIDVVRNMVPELDHDLLAGATQATGMSLDTIIDPGSNYLMCISSFIAAVQQGRYWDASRLEPLFSDIERLRGQLVGNSGMLCMLVYCLGVLFLNGHRDKTKAARLFSELAVIAKLGGPEATHYAQLAESHIALTRP